MLKPIIFKNGLTVLRLPRQNSRACVIGFVVASGSSYEYGYFPQGISYLIERMFLNGTTKYPNSRSLALAIEAIGGQFESITTEEHMHFYLQAPSEHQYKALSILSEIIQNSLFDPMTIEREKKKIVEEFKYRDEKLLESLNNAAMNDLFRENGLGLPIKGNIDSIMSIKAEDVQEYIAHQFSNDRSFLVFGGNFDNKLLLEKAEQEWLHFNPRAKRFIDAPEIIGVNEIELPSMNYRQRGLSQTYMSISFLLPKVATPDDPISVEDRLSMMVKENFLASLIGDGLSSKLWSKVVEDEVLAHYVSAEVDQYKNTSVLKIQAIVDNSQFTFALESILSVLENLKKTTISINEVARTKEILKGKWIMQQEPIVSEIVWQMDNLISLGEPLNFEDTLEVIDEIDPIMVRDIANNVFVTDRLSLTTLGTAKETRLIEKLFRRYLG
ncbi:MAG: pitrilysin family protein [Patescibacteria group bacterium]